MALAGEEGDGDVQLPVGWEAVTLPPPGKSYLLSPGVDREGRASKRVKVYTPYHLTSLQGPTTRNPGGRFHELSREHFPWLKPKETPYKRLQVLLSNCKNINIVLNVIR